MRMPAAVGVTFNTSRLVRTRLLGVISQPSVNVVTTPDGSMVGLPGQGGVVRAVGFGDRAGGWASDHLEPGVSVRHPDLAADRALQEFACVGNPATVLDGPAAGARGIVFGKHGALLCAFAPEPTALMAPGERVSVDAIGVGLEIEGEPDVVVRSCDPDLLRGMVLGRDKAGGLLVKVVVTLPAEAAGAGAGMSSLRFDVDLMVDETPVIELAGGLRFGDIVALQDQDHRVARGPRRGWLSIGVICHGRSVGGGHGLGLTTLLTGPAERFTMQYSPEATLDRMMPLPWGSTR